MLLNKWEVGTHFLYYQSHSNSFKSFIWHCRTSRFPFWSQDQFFRIFCSQQHKICRSRLESVFCDPSSCAWFLVSLDPIYLASPEDTASAALFELVQCLDQWISFRFHLLRSRRDDLALKSRRSDVNACKRLWVFHIKGLVKWQEWGFPLEAIDFISLNLNHRSSYLLT